MCIDLSGNESGLDEPSKMNPLGHESLLCEQFVQFVGCSIGYKHFALVGRRQRSAHPTQVREIPTLHRLQNQVFYHSLDRIAIQKLKYN